ncbi:Uncharacterised protein [Chlamydia trachomatis]|nr:Uncharacterised protein [Chlamydia trachomatis]
MRTPSLEKYKTYLSETLSSRAIIFSPRATPKAAPVEKKKGVSMPICSAKERISSSDSPVLKIWFKANNAVAALLLPPARPAPTGICLTTRQLTGVVMPVYRRKSATLFHIELLGVSR